MCSSLPSAPRLKLQEGQRRWWDPAGRSTNQQRCESLKRLTGHTKNDSPRCGDVAENWRAISWVMHIPVWHLPVACKVPLVQPQLPGRSASGGQKPQGCAFKYLWLFSSFNPKFSALRKPRPQSCDQFSSFSRAKPQLGGEREDTRQREESRPRDFRNKTMARILEDEDYYQVFISASNYCKGFFNCF